MSLSSGSPGRSLFWMPSRTAMSIAEKSRYGLAALSGPRYSIRRLLRAGAVDRNADDRRPVPAAVGDLGGGLEALDQPLVAIRGRIGEGAQGRGVLEQAADRVHPQVAQARVALAGQERLVVLPERQVRVHARAVVAK